MKDIKALLQQGSLSSACKLLETKLQNDPLNTDIRATYVEVLCIQGELEKADQQLDMMVRQTPDLLVGAVNLRQLIRAQQAREDFYKGGVTATLFSDTDAMYEAQLKMRLELNDEHLAEAENAAFEVETARKKLSFEVNGERVADVRDLDDSLGGYLEVFGTDGKFYLTKFSEIETLEVKKAESLVDLIWRRIEIDIKNGPSGEAFLPIIYVDSQTEAERLGRETDWQELTEKLILGRGQKMLLMGDRALPINDLVSISQVSSEQIREAKETVEAVQS